MKLSMIFIQIITLAISASSCNRYVDKAKTERKASIYQGKITYYADSNVLVYKSKGGLNRGDESRNARPFYIKLPKRLMSWQFANHTDFSFNYSQKQGIFIFIDLFNDIKTKDTAFAPTQKNIQRFPLYLHIDKDKYAFSNIPMLKNRKYYIIYKGDAIILLYNILPSNYDRFLQAANSFKFL